MLVQNDRTRVDNLVGGPAVRTTLALSAADAPSLPALPEQYDEQARASSQ
jgi:hypothetical protein